MQDYHYLIAFFPNNKLFLNSIQNFTFHNFHYIRLIFNKKNNYYLINSKTHYLKS